MSSRGASPQEGQNSFRAAFFREGQTGLIWPGSASLVSTPQQASGLGARTHCGPTRCRCRCRCRAKSRCNRAPLGPARPGCARPGCARPGPVRMCSARMCSARPGPDVLGLSFHEEQASLRARTLPSQSPRGVTRGERQARAWAAATESRRRRAAAMRADGASVPGRRAAAHGPTGPRPHGPTAPPAHGPTGPPTACDAGATRRRRGSERANEPPSRGPSPCARRTLPAGPGRSGPVRSRPTRGARSSSR